MSTTSTTAPAPSVEDPRIVDLFAGPGGLDVAAHWLGLPVVGVEFDKAAVETRWAAGLETVFGDVRDYGPADFPGANVLTGGPPCQTFTVAGTGHGRRALDTVLKLVEMLAADDFTGVEDEVATMDDERTGLVLQPLIWALMLERTGAPYEAIVLEQVPAVLPVWEAMGQVLRTRGYGVDVGIVKTEQYGVPQTRRRAILIARHGVPDTHVRLPGPTHQAFRRGVTTASPDSLPNAEGLPRWISMAEALGDDREFVVRSNYGQGGDPKRRGIRRHDEPAFTVTGKVSRNRLVLPDGTYTRLTSDQAGRLQTFPAAFPWSGTDQAQQIGNAIPPRLGTHILAAALGLRRRRLTDRFFADRLSSWEEPSARQKERSASIGAVSVST